MIDMLEETQLKQFKIGDIFDVINGKKYPKDQRLTGNIPLISTSSYDNGISDYVSFPAGSGFEKVSNVITIAYSGSVGATYYHPFEVFVGETVMYLKKKEGTLTRRQNLFIVSIIRKLMKKYSYTNKVKLSDVRNNIEFSLPVTSDGSPDWDYMEAYIADIEHKYVDNVRKFNQQENDLLKELHPGGEKQDSYNFADFRLGDIVNFYKGKRVTKSSQIPGNIPYVTAVSTNNGIDNYISNPVETKERMVTMNFFGDCFYQPASFGIKDGTYAVEIKEEKHRSEKKYLYLAAVLQKVGKSVGSYSKMLTDSIAKDLLVSLPSTPDGSPDWDYMEKYISYIESRERERVELFLSAKKS